MQHYGFQPCQIAVAGKNEIINIIFAFSNNYYIYFITNYKFLP